jgi:hypothetical protein
MDQNRIRSLIRTRLFRGRRLFWGRCFPLQRVLKISVAVVVKKEALGVYN